MTAVSVAKQLVVLAEEKGVQLNQTKLQKLLYIIYGVYYVTKRRTLFEEEPICMPYGPVFISVYNYYKSHPIEKEFFDTSNNNSDITDMITQTLDVFGAINASVLSQWSHREGSAWSLTDKMTDRWGAPIPPSYIDKEFQQMVIKNAPE